MLPLDIIPVGTTVQTLVTEVVPEVHARLVEEGGPDEELAIAVRIDGSGSWTLRIRRNVMTVDEGEDQRVSMWLYATTRDVERFLEDALGPGRLGSKTLQRGGVSTVTDPRVIKRLALASGRIELAVHDESDERIAMVLGFGGAARRPIDPVAPDAVVEAQIATVERVLRGQIAPDEALGSGAVTVRGSRLLPMQLALAMAPFWKFKP
ncbi:MAG: hypothetical protein M3O50_22125 [Myxococcota bacterium]|nr:hypothetical protein [Myxococcota bacterium]